MSFLQALVNYTSISNIKNIKCNVWPNACQGSEQFYSLTMYLHVCFAKNIKVVLPHWNNVSMLIETDQ